MAESFDATADVAVKDGLVCVTIIAPGAPETIMRMPRDLAVKMARKILEAASDAPASWPTARRTGQGGGDA